MESILQFMRPLCFFGNNKKKKKQQHERKPQRPLVKNDQPTLQDCILSSPTFSKSSPATSNKRVHPNNDVSMEQLLLHKTSPLLATSNKRVHPDDDIPMKRLLLEDKETVTKMEDYSSSRGMRKKRVSFRRPEVVDVFIILAASPTTHHSSDLQPF